MAAIRDAIEVARKRQHCSLRQLATLLERDEKTLARWRDGSTQSIDVPALVQLFDLAGLSMDESFGLRVEEVQVQAEPSSEWQEDVERRLSTIEQFLAPSMMRWLSDKAYEKSGGRGAPADEDLRKAG